MDLCRTALRCMMGVINQKDFIKKYGALQVIFEEGELGTKMYIVQKGTINISKENNGESVHLATLAQGEIFGEMALLENMPRSATATAGKNGATILEIDSSLLVYLISQQPVFALVILKSMSQRLRNQSKNN